MSVLIDKILEKHALAMPNWFKKLKPVKWYTDTAKSPGFKAKKAIGTTALVAAPAAYGIHQLAKPPEPIQRPQQNSPF